MLKFSVVVCTYNRIDYLKKCLNSIFDLDYFNYEVVVVNDGSLDGTVDYLESIGRKNFFFVSHKDNSGLSKARNMGVKVSNGEVVVFVDDDCVVDKNILKAYSQKFTENKNLDFVIGQLFYVAKDYVGRFPERVVQNLDCHWPMGSSSAYRKEAFLKFGLYREEYFYYHNEDSEWAVRAVSSGAKYDRESEAIIYHQKAFWNYKTLLSSARNASVWVRLKKEYKQNYNHFGSPIKFGFIIYPVDYIYILFFPMILPVLLIRYIINGKREFRIFFAKWPVYLFVRRFCIYKEAIKNKVFII